MDPTYVYTSDDAVDPVFCPMCKQHVPRAVVQAGGLCPQCYQAQMDAQAAAAQQANAAAQAAAARAAARRARWAVYWTGGPTRHIHVVMALMIALLALWAAVMHITIINQSDRLARTQRELESVESELDRTTALAENANHYAHSHPGM